MEQSPRPQPHLHYHKIKGPQHADMLSISQLLPDDGGSGKGEVETHSLMPLAQAAEQRPRR